MLELIQTSIFRKDLKRAIKRGLPMHMMEEKRQNRRGLKLIKSEQNDKNDERAGYHR